MWVIVKLVILAQQLFHDDGSLSIVVLGTVTIILRNVRTTEFWI